eukprot:10407888-Lingulodinium_polyedra.AAC.1
MVTSGTPVGRRTGCNTANVNRTNVTTQARPKTDPASGGIATTHTAQAHVLQPSVHTRKHNEHNEHKRAHCLH